MDREIDEVFLQDPNNNLDDITGREFDDRFDKFCKANSISKKDCEGWASDFQMFLYENPTFIMGAEQARVLNRFFVY